MSENNYRQILIVTALYKVFKQVQLSRLARYLRTEDSQFGFKEAHETEMALFALKQTVYFYRNQDTPVFICFLNVINAFDRVYHLDTSKETVRWKRTIEYCEIIYFSL